MSFHIEHVLMHTNTLLATNNQLIEIIYVSGFYIRYVNCHIKALKTTEYFKMSEVNWQINRFILPSGL